MYIICNMYVARTYVNADLRPFDMDPKAIVTRDLLDLMEPEGRIGRFPDAFPGVCQYNIRQPY